jgi:hypothetical protein
MKLVAALLSLFLATAFSTCSPILPPTAVSAAQATVYHTGQETITGASMCSATAIGPHTLLTASHCENPTNDLKIQGLDDATIVKIIRDGNDHTIYYLTGVTFPTYSTVDITHVFTVGEDVFQFGFPGKWAKLYRRGYYMGNPDSGDTAKTEPIAQFFDFSVWHGDSGAGVFDTNGDLISVVSVMAIQTQGPDDGRIQATGCFDILFKQSDLDQARAF